jgi:plastocyanin
MRPRHLLAAIATGLAVQAQSGAPLTRAAPSPVDAWGSRSPDGALRPKTQNGAVTGTVTILKDGAPKANRSWVAVYLEGVPGVPPTSKATAIRQKDLTFLPGVLVVTVGSTVEFPNDDKVFHNVFSFSSAARFDLGLYKSGTTKAVTFKKPGVVDVYCNIHPQMAARIKVLDSAYYAVTGPDGSFRIKDVPLGTYPFVAWQAYGDEHRGEVTVTPGGVAALAISLVEGKPPKRHLRKDGTPYGRYK